MYRYGELTVVIGKYESVWAHEYVAGVRWRIKSVEERRSRHWVTMF